MEVSYYPNEGNLGRNCLFWNLDETNLNCCYPKAELEGRRSCEGIVDDVCLYILERRIPKSLTEAERQEIRLRIPLESSSELLPPGDTV
jgi:hypothetical protein